MLNLCKWYSSTIKLIFDVFMLVQDKKKIRGKKKTKQYLVLGLSRTWRKLWLAMMRASWALRSSGWAWLLLMPCTSWGMWSATAFRNTHHHTHQIKHACRMSHRSMRHFKSYRSNQLGEVMNANKENTMDNELSEIHSHSTLQLCTSCCWDAVFLLETAAFWAAAMVWVAAAAACLAAI